MENITTIILGTLVLVLGGLAYLNSLEAQESRMWQELYKACDAQLMLHE